MRCNSWVKVLTVVIDQYSNRKYSSIPLKIRNERSQSIVQMHSILIFEGGIGESWLISWEEPVALGDSAINNAGKHLA